MNMINNNSNNNSDKFNERSSSKSFKKIQKTHIFSHTLKLLCGPFCKKNNNKFKKSKSNNK